MTIQVALIGAGGIGNAHSNAYQQIKEAKITAVVDIRPEYAEKIASLHGAKVYTSVDDFLEHEHVDMVDICTPAFTHPEIAIQCIQHNIHTLVEKPVAYRLEQAKVILETLEKHPVIFMVAQVIRFWNEYTYLKQIYDQETYGKLVQIWFTRVCATPLWGWENWYVDPVRSGYAPFELHIHDVDYIHFLLGKPDRVQAVAVHKPEIFTSFLKSQFHYDRNPGLIVEAEAGWWKGPIPFAATFRAVFEKAVLVYNSEKLFLYEQEASSPHTVDLNNQVQLGSAINLKSTSGIYNEIAYFINCLATSRAPTILTPEQSYISLNMLLSALDSARANESIRL